MFSSYFDREEVDCDSRGGIARYDRYGEGEGDVQRSERVTAEDREMVEATLGDIANGCTTC